MDKTELTPELEKLMNRVRLKEPPEKLMADYLAGVNARIDRGPKGFHFGFPELAILLVVGLTLAGALYLFLVRPHVEPALDNEPITVIASEAKQSPSSQIASATFGTMPRNDEQQATTSQSLSLEGEMEVLEAFSEEFQDEATDLFGDEEVFEELAQLDELELSPALSTPTSGV